MPLSELRPYGPQGHDVPRYMTYPTTDWFVEAFGAAQVRDWLSASERLGPGNLPALTVTLPGAADQMGASAWLGAYGRETALYARLLAQGRALGEVHWSLGRDTLPPSWLAALLDVLACGFYLGTQPRMSVTIDPACAQILPYLAELGFSRADIGFGASCGAAAHGEQYRWNEWHARALAHAHSVRDDARVSIGLCLRYGAPGQSKAAFGRALDEVLACQPGRIQIQHIAAARAEPQGRNVRAALPRARLPMLRWIAARLLEAGYSRVAGDYYARPADLFGIAQRRARLALRPYGLSAEGGHTTIALGPAAIGAVGPMYYQNQRNPADYMALLARDELPVMRGVGLSADDLVRRSVIHSLSCNLFVDIEALTLAFGIDFERHFAAEQPMLHELERAGLISRSAGAIEIVGDGLLQVDNVCMVFDAHLRRRHASGPYRASL